LVFDFVCLFVFVTRFSFFHILIIHFIFSCTDKDNPQWFNLTSVRPSTSINLSKRASDVLNSDSNANEMEITEEWYKNLSQSDTFNKLKEVAKKNPVKNLKLLTYKSVQYFYVKVVRELNKINEFLFC